MKMIRVLIQLPQPLKARLDAPQRQQLLQAYRRGGGRIEGSRMELFRALLHLVAASWAAAQIVAAEEGDLYRQLAEDYTRRAEPLIAGPEFPSLVAAIR